MDDVFKELVNALAQWETVGLMGVAIGLVYALVKLTKLPIVAPLFVGRGWLRPVIAAALGALAGALAAIQGHQPWGQVVAAALTGALTAGLGAVGWDQAVTQASRTGKERAAIEASSRELIDAGEAEIEAKVQEAKAALDAAAAVPAGPARRAALADWAKKNLRASKLPPMPAGSP